MLNEMLLSEGYPLEGQTLVAHANVIFADFLDAFP